MVTVECPAKTNITLSVAGRRPEWGNRHELDTIYCGLTLADTLVVRPAPPGSGPLLSLSGDHLGDLSGRDDNHGDNHAIRAVLALSEASGIAPDVSLRIVKRIPVAAGLGGGSSDAAGVLLALNALWGLNWPLSRLSVIAARLGSDMPFCLVGGFGHGTGYGERIEALPPGRPQALGLDEDGFTGTVLVGAYDDRLSTPEVYRRFDEIGANPGDSNDLQRAAISLHPRSGEAVDIAAATGARHAMVSGSGPTVVAFVPDDTVRESVRRAWAESGAVDYVLSARAPCAPVVLMHPTTRPRQTLTLQ
nr:4-(cytidine 5'-diphospho)-2-C-methyl-D-erythritol kinase [uncultured Bifidobacterium sp.]